jgi:hypothetical protein
LTLDPGWKNSDPGLTSQIRNTDKNDHSIYIVLFYCSEILDKAALAEDNYEQMAYVAAFTLSAYRWLHKIINSENGN